MEQLQNLIDPVSSFLWGWLLIYVLLATGLYFSIRTRWSSSAASAICGAWCSRRGAARRVGSPFSRLGPPSTSSGVFMTVVVFAFAFSSVLGNYAYADANLTYLGCGRATFLAFRIVALGPGTHFLARI